jgi:hypothetical protein
MHGVQRGNRQKMQNETFRMASVDEVDTEEMQNQTAEDIIRKSSVFHVRYMPEVRQPCVG